MIVTTKETIEHVRNKLDIPPSCVFGKLAVLELVECLVGCIEQAEARAEKAEANMARLTKERDWLANNLIDCPRLTNCAVDCAECRKEAARKAVADSEVK